MALSLKTAFFIPGLAPFIALALENAKSKAPNPPLNPAPNNAEYIPLFHISLGLKSLSNPPRVEPKVKSVTTGAIYFPALGIVPNAFIPALYTPAPVAILPPASAKLDAIPTNPGFTSPGLSIILFTSVWLSSSPAFLKAQSEAPKEAPAVPFFRAVSAPCPPPDKPTTMFSHKDGSVLPSFCIRFTAHFTALGTSGCNSG